MNKIKIDSFKQYKYLANPSFSPKANHFIFEITEVAKDGKSYLTSLYELKDRKTKRLTSNSGSSFVFFDEDNIIFTDKREKIDKDKKGPFTVIYKLNLNGGEAEKFLEFHRNLKPIYVMGDKIILIENYEKKWDGFDKLSEKEREALIEKNKEDEDYHVFDEIPFWSNGSGVTNKNRSRLAVYDINDQSLKLITDKLSDVYPTDFNEEKKKILLISSRYEDKLPLYNQIYEYDLEKDSLTDISPFKDMSYSFAFYLKNNILTLASNLKKHGINENGSLYLFDKDTKKVLKENFSDLSLWSSVGSDVRYGGGKTYKTDGDYFYFTSTKEYTCELFRLNESLEIEQITKSGGSIDFFDIKNGKIISVALVNQDLQELYEIKDKELIKLSKINTENDDKYIAKPELIKWGENGYKYTGFVLLPEDYDSKKTYPAILDIHGGPKTVYGTVFYHEMQYWASEGYIVFFTNPRGSDGYGNEFMDIFGKYGDVDYHDLMHFTDLVLEKYTNIDKTRLYVTGGSYGGFMTNWIIGHTDRFRRAASQRSIANWISMWGTTDIGYYFANDQTRAEVWDDFDKMWDQSPMKYANKVKTPTLFIHSDEDYRCYHVEGIQMYTSLKYHGVEAKLVMFKNENHELSRSGLPHHRLRRLSEITEWFKK